MNINNSIVNQMIRDGESHPTFQLQPPLCELIDAANKLTQTGDRVPLLDFLRVIIESGRQALSAGLHPAQWTGLSIPRNLCEALKLSVERCEPLQVDLLTPAIELIEQEQEHAVQAHGIARSIVQNSIDKQGYTIEDLIEQLDKSPNRKLSLKMMGKAGQNCPDWQDKQDRLSRIEAELAQTLPSRFPVEVHIAIHNVNERTGLAEVEIEGMRSDYERRTLSFFPNITTLIFDKSTIERDDLIALQYRQERAWVTASATCPTTPSSSKKALLTLISIKVPRQSLDRWHATARQQPIDLFERQ